MKIPFHKPNLPESLDLIYRESLRSGWLTTGDIVNSFEEKLSSYLNSDYVVALNSCTAGLHLALAAKNFGKGDKFILPTMTFISTLECGEYLGMEPILVDSEKSGFLLDLNQVEDLLKKQNNVKAILPMHYGGEPANMNCIFKLAEKYGVFVLEDAAHALDTVSNYGKIGDTNHGAAFSFYANKNITTAGEGGALATNDKKLAEKVRRLSLHGITKDGWERFKENGKWEYDIIELGYKYNMTDFSASFGLWQLEKAKIWQEKRKSIVKYYHQKLKNIDGIILPKLTNGHSWHLFVIKLDLKYWKISRNSIIEKLNKRGIGLAVHYKPIHKLLYVKSKYSFPSDQFPRSNELFESIISFPIYPNLTFEELDQITENVIRIYKQYSL